MKVINLGHTVSEGVDENGIGSVILLGGIFLVVIYRSGLSKEFKENNLEFYDLKKWSSLKTASWLIFWTGIPEEYIKI